MTNVTTRLVLIVVMVLAVHVGFLYVQRGGMPTDIREPLRNLKALPMEFGPWKGKEIKVDPKITGGTEAWVVVDREYRDGVGAPIVLHFNAMTRYFMDLRHHPEHCYTTHGSELVDRRPVDLELPDGSTLRTELLAMEREGQRFLVLYWYQLGDHVILSGDEQREVRGALRGQETWPPLIKVLLQTPAANAEQDEQRLSDLAKLVYSWTRDVDRLPADDDPAK